MGVESAAVHRFDADTAVTRLAPAGDGQAFEARMDRGWWIVRGPNGGYVAAVLLRALTETVGDAGRAPRSLTVHYAAPPAEGPVRIETRIERAGRSLSTVSARMSQDGRMLALALGAFSTPRTALEMHHARMPEAAPPEACAPRGVLPGGFTLPIHRRYEQLWAVGGRPYSGAGEALCGGWIRFADGARTPDALAVAAFTDAFPPTVMSTLTPGSSLGAMPTVDLTIHFRVSLPFPGLGPDAFLLAAFRAREAREGFFEEDGEIWTPDGVLVAQSRQLAVLM